MSSVNRMHSPISNNTTDATPPKFESEYIALSEVRGGMVGMAALRLQTNELILSQFADSHTYALTLNALFALDGENILLSDTTTNSALVSFINACQFLENKLQFIPRRAFNENKGMEEIERVRLKGIEKVVSTKVVIGSEYFAAVASTSALFSFLEKNTELGIADNSLRITVRSVHEFMRLDVRSAIALNLVPKKPTKQKKTVPVDGNANRTAIKQRKAKISSYPTANGRTSLFEIINHCRTSGGERLLRASLLQPFRNKQSIETRLDATQQLASNEELFYELCHLIGLFQGLESDIGSTLLRPSQSTSSRILFALQLKSWLENLQRVAQILGSLVSDLNMDNKDQDEGLLSNMHKLFTSNICDTMRETIGSIVTEAADVKKKDAQSIRTQLIFSVKPGLNGLLDANRQIYYDAMDDLNKEAKELCAEWQRVIADKAPGCHCDVKLAFSARKGYYLSVDEHSIETLKRLANNQKGGPVKKDDEAKSMVSSLSTIGLINKLRCPVQLSKMGRKRYCCTTESILSLNSRQNEAHAEVISMNARIVDELMEKLVAHSHWLFSVCDALSLIDMLLSFTQTVMLSVSPWVRPEMTENGPCAIKNGRHPILQELTSGSIVPNDLFLSTSSNVAVLTAPNNAGKSCYLRQLALITILAQIGCFVPAEFASIRCTDALFLCGIYEASLELTMNEDDNTSNCYRDMRDAANILQYANNKCLVLSDECGRSCANIDGVSLSWAIIEDLAFRKNCYTLVATHFLEITRLADLYPNIKNIHISVETSRQNTNNLATRIKSTYSIKDGPFAQNLRYGIAIAELCAFPHSITSEAHKISTQLSELKFCSTF